MNGFYGRVLLRSWTEPLLIDRETVLNMIAGDEWYGDKGDFAQVKNAKGIIARRTCRKSLCYKAGGIPLGKWRNHARDRNTEIAFQIL